MSRLSGPIDAPGTRPGGIITLREFNAEAVSMEVVETPRFRFEAIRRHFTEHSKGRFASDLHSVFIVVGANSIVTNSTTFVDGPKYRGRVATTPTAAVCPSGREMVGEITGHGFTDYVTASFSQSLVNEILGEAGKDPAKIEIVPHALAIDETLLGAGRRLLNECRTDLFGRELAMESIGSEIAVHVLRHYTNSGVIIAQPGGDTADDPRIRRARDFIHANLDRHLSLSEIAAIAGMSPYHFSRSFRVAYHRPPHRYVVEARIEVARQLLRSARHLSIAEVAARSGFADQSHFARTFQRIIGQSPTSFRRESR